MHDLPLSTEQIKYICALLVDVPVTSLGDVGNCTLMHKYKEHLLMLTYKEINYMLQDTRGSYLLICDTWLIRIAEVAEEVVK